MARGRLTFKQRDITRAFKGAHAAGLPDPVVEVSKEGVIRITPGHAANNRASSANEWDSVK